MAEDVITQNSITYLNQLVRLPLLKQILGKGRSTIYREIGLGLLMKPVKIGGGRVAWPSNEIKVIVNARVAGKNDNEIKILVSNLEASRSSYVN